MRLSDEIQRQYDNDIDSPATSHLEEWAKRARELEDRIAGWEEVEREEGGSHHA
jgi:hypothetical protein